nr:EOG090X03KG [Eulimnadia texana]
MFLGLLFAVLLFSPLVSCIDITDQVFEQNFGIRLAAFGDFNSDKLTDVFVLQNDMQGFEVLLANEKAPFLRNSGIRCTFQNQRIVSLVPGDFDGDSAMDVLVVSQKNYNKLNNPNIDLYVAWGSLDAIECPVEENPLLSMLGEPLVIDYDSNMISDIFGLNVENQRTFWIFGTNRTVHESFPMGSGSFTQLKIPHSHAFIDFDGDMASDILLTTEKGFEVWRYNTSGFELNRTIPLPSNTAIFGQSLFVDFNSDGVIDLLLPVCFDYQCQNVSFQIFHQNEWLVVDTDFVDTSNNLWYFPAVDKNHLYFNTIAARSGDFNLDGFPDLLVTLVSKKTGSQPRAVLFENTFCEKCHFRRKLVPNWDALNQYNSSVLATFYDIQENGILDLLVISSDTQENYYVSAYKNSLDYDANFMKILVLTGRCYLNCTHGKIPYGTNLPGPFIKYRTTNPNGETQVGCSGQLSQSAYTALHLPYSVFGLGHTPNFVEVLEVGLAFRDPAKAQREWTQIIPNSQMVIIPNLSNQPRYWLNKLFVTPSRAIALSAAALAGVATVLAGVVAVLHCRERRADRKEKLEEAYKFHFDAM